MCGAAATALGSDYKRRRLVVGEKVCIVCICHSGNSDYVIFIIDPNDDGGGGDGFVTRFPTLRLDVKSFMLDAFCVLGSRLFVFEGSAIADDSIKKSVFTFDLSSVIVNNTNEETRVEKSSRNCVGEMHHPKRYPQASPTPDGKKILVFSSVINHPSRPLDYGMDPDDEIVADVFDFELYDPDRNSWIKLPRICHNWLDAPIAFTIDNNSTFQLRTCVGLFSLDLEGGITAQWDSGRVPENFPSCGRFFVIGNKFYLSCHGAFDISKSTFSQFSLSSPTAGAGTVVYRHISLLGKEDAGGGGGGGGGGECNFCVAQVWADEDRGMACMIIDVCSIDSTKYKESDKVCGARLETRINKTFKFVMDKPCNSFASIDMLSM